MEYRKKQFTDRATVAQISTFAGRGGTTEYHLLLSCTNPALPFTEQLQHIQQTYAAILEEELPDTAIAVCENSFCALSVVEQAPENGTKIALWTWFQTGIAVETTRNGMLKAEHNGYTQYWTGGASNHASNSEYQTRLLLNDYVMQLLEEGGKLATDCIRTWFFVQNVDVNYAGVVKARKEVFVTQGLTEQTHYIASTGINGRHADPTVLVQMDTYAVKGLQPGQIQYLYAPTHLNPTYEYGVTFERGTAVTYGDRRHVFISGTASIDNKGEIVYPGDVRMQTERMMENISVLLAEADATMADVMQAIVYLRDPADYAVVSQYLEEHFPALPCLIVHAPVCRPGWLIETECIAAVPAEEAYAPL